MKTATSTTRATAFLTTLGGALGLAACDPLTDGSWRGLPAMVVQLDLVGLPADDDAHDELVLVWARLDGGGTAMWSEGPEVASLGLGAFELRLRERPPIPDLDSAGLAIALPVVLGVEVGEHVPERVDVALLGETARAVSDDHYLVYTEDAEAVRARGSEALLNPIALEDGFNLAVGVCRPGRPSQVLIVPPERLALVPVETVRDGSCLDVFWGAWRL